MSIFFLILQSALALSRFTTDDVNDNNSVRISSQYQDLTSEWRRRHDTVQHIRLQHKTLGSTIVCPILISDKTDNGFQKERYALVVKSVNQTTRHSSGIR